MKGEDHATFTNFEPPGQPCRYRDCAFKSGVRTLIKGVNLVSLRSEATERLSELVRAASGASGTGSYTTILILLDHLSPVGPQGF